MAGDAGPLLHYHNLSNGFYIDKTWLLHHIVTNIIVEVSLRPTVSTHQQPQVYSIWRKDLSVTNKLVFASTWEKKQNRNWLVSHVTMCISCHLSRARCHCSEAIVLSFFFFFSIRKHVRLSGDVLTSCVKTENSKKKKKCFWRSHVNFHLRPHIAPWGRKK